MSASVTVRPSDSHSWPTIHIIEKQVEIGKGHRTHPVTSDSGFLVEVYKNRGLRSKPFPRADTLLAGRASDGSSQLPSLAQSG